MVREIVIEAVNCIITNLHTEPLPPNKRVHALWAPEYGTSRELHWFMKKTFEEEQEVKQSSTSGYPSNRNWGATDSAMPVVPSCLNGNIRYPNLNDSKPSKMKPSRVDFMSHSQNQGCSPDIFLIKLGTTNGENMISILASMPQKLEKFVYILSIEYLWMSLIFCNSFVSYLMWAFSTLFHNLNSKKHETHNSLASISGSYFSLIQTNP